MLLSSQALTQTFIYFHQRCIYSSFDLKQFVRLKHAWTLSIPNDTNPQQLSKDMRVFVFCPTIMSSANPIYETLKYLDEDDIVMDYSDDKFLDELEEIEKEKEDLCR